MVCFSLFNTHNLYYTNKQTRQNAYVLKEAYDEAIPYLKKSIEDANKKEDLIIKKDATRKLSEVYATVGDYTKALDSYQSYVKLVDTLYSKKTQEIQSKSLNFQYNLLSIYYSNT